LYLGEKIDIPVLYITQAIGLAIGISGDKLGTGKHFVKTDQFISQLNINKVQQNVTEAV
jgi:heterodisulfide reductase subunit B